jgi:prevent-host-death family protein
MSQTGVRNPKDHLSDYLRRVQRGARVVITDRGRAVATLVGPPEQEAEDVGWSLVRLGLGAWSGGKPRGLANPPSVPGRRAEEAVLEDRW